MKKQAEIYIHIPFCVKKCAYCDFLSAPATEKVKMQYVQRLIQEISTSKWARMGISVPTIFIGGGTPSILPGEDIVRIMETVRSCFAVDEEAEITIECNPGTLTYEKLAAYKKAGINRLSIGLQSANNEELQLLGRIHTYEEFLDSYGLAREMGFSNINVDLMSALPGQTIESYGETLKKVCELQPEHISAYSLIIEEGTPFYQQYAQDNELREKGKEPKVLPSEEMERKMYEDTKTYLEQAGYKRYEISNYAKAGYECRHNKGYWTRVPYIGFGLGAAGLMEETRCQNEGNLAEYLQGNFPGEEQVLTTKEQMEEFMFLGLRLTDGVSGEKFQEAFGKTIRDVYGEKIDSLIENKLVKMDLLNQDLFLTDYGRDISNYVLSHFLF